MQQYEQFENNFSTSSPTQNQNSLSFKRKTANKFLNLFTQKNSKLVSLLIFILCFLVILILFLVDKSKTKSLANQLASNSHLLEKFSSISAKDHDTRLKYDDLKKLSQSLNSEITQTKETIDKGIKTNNELQIEVTQRRNTISDLTLKLESILREIDELTKKNDEIISKTDELDKKIKELNKGQKAENYQISNDELIDSNILTKSSDVISLKNMVSQDRVISLNLLYRASRDKFNSQSFHERCDFHKETVVLVGTVQEDIFGGYTTKSWDGEEFKKDKYAFLFNLNLGKKYPVVDEDKAIFCSQSLLACFGKGDIVMDNYKVASYFPISYGNLGDRALELTNMKDSFQIKDIEVFAVEYK